jgi:membrane associated rhomboid family serine protease
MAYTEKEYKKRISVGQSTNALTMLIIVNLVFFVTFAFIKVFFLFMNRQDEAHADALFQQDILQWVTVPANIDTLLTKPWTIFTSIFLHVGVWSILANMLWLWTFGYIFQDLTGNRKVVPVYIYGGLAGVIAFLLCYNLLPSLQGASASTVFYGGSAGIAAIAIATTLTSPGYRIFPMLNGGIPLWILTAFYIVITIATTPSGNIANYMPSVAGALMGYLFIVLIRFGYDWSDWMNNFYDWISNLFNPDKPKKGKNIKDELFYNSPAAPFKKTPNVTQQRIDDILDKINQKGFNSLTDEEKELLKRASSDL